ncbi:hypothetical protein MNBD_GAMMA22-2329 [hydrothermal vent metagenome]|uniref:DUF4870 domain-containing protein n=1 Tax=hydrothermal vent metagenome TaxID=652676 RepID=A0A3B0ZFA0_9ZZZZ
MKKYILISLLGLIIMLGGCIPFGVAIQNAVNTNEVLNESIPINKNYITSVININTRHLILPALKIHFSSNEVNSNTLLQSNEYEAKFQFPVSLIISDINNKKLYKYTDKLDWNHGTKSYDLNNVNSQQAEVIVEIDLDKILIPKPGKIKLSVFIADDSIYKAKLHSAKLIVYDNVYQHSSNILIGVGILFFGMLVLVIGIILIIRYQAQTPHKNKTKYSAPAEAERNSSINTSAMLCHLSTFSGIFVPFGGILGPLIFWLVKKDEHPFINRHGIAALNFHLSMMIYYFVSFLLAFIIIGFFLLIMLALADFILSIIASIKASNGEEYQYPFAVPFINEVKN